MKTLLFCLAFYLLGVCATYSQSLLSVTPTSASLGETVLVSMTGQNTSFGQGTTTTDVWFLQGTSTVILPNYIIYASSTNLIAEFTFCNNNLGVYDLFVFDAVDGGMMLPASFTLNPESNPAEIVLVDPDMADRGDIFSVSLTGQNTDFLQGTMTTVWFSQGSSTIIADLVNGISSTNLVADFTIPMNAAYGLWDVNAIDGGCNSVVTLVDGFTISPPGGCAVTALATATNVSAPGMNDGTVAISANNGATPYTYLWSGGQTAALVTGLSPGVYSCTVIDGIGCSTGAVAVVQAFVCSLTGVVSGTPETSSGATDGTASVVASGGSAPYTYLWASLDSSSSIANLAPGFYSVTVTDANGCTYAASAAVNPGGTNCTLAVTVSGTNESQAGANDGTAMVNVTEGTALVTLWNPGGQTTSTISGLAPAHYTVTVTDSANCNATGTHSVSPGLIIGVFEQPKTVISVKVYPNPAVDMINFEITGTDRAILYVYDFAGRQVKEVSISELLTEINTNNLGNGMYIYRLIDKKGSELRSGKFILQK